jgi:hypothetical protein
MMTGLGRDDLSDAENVGKVVVGWRKLIGETGRDHTDTERS